MPKKHRVDRTEFPTSSRGRLIGRLFSLVFSASTAHSAKTAFVVSKKVAAKAAERNRIKRRAREAVRALIHSLPPLTFVYTARNEAKSASFEDIQRDITSLAEQAISRYNAQNA